ncbi:hypothetical protein XHV734_4683 [Xanthomonas hortorum pv. vitians]|nr:hypothetical protein XHV734_4683 [Xanthomonas hortorum pv. vitians]
MVAGDIGPALVAPDRRAAARVVDAGRQQRGDCVQLGPVHLGDQRRACDRSQPGLLHQSVAERVAGRAGAQGTPAAHPVGGGGVRHTRRAVVDPRCRCAAVDRLGAGVFVRCLRLAAQAGGGGSGGRVGRGKRVSVRAGAAAGRLGRAGPWRRFPERLGVAHRPAADLRRRGDGGAADRVCVWRAADSAVAGGHPAIHRAEPAAAAGRVVLPRAVRSGARDWICGDLGGVAVIRWRQRVAFAAAGCGGSLSIGRARSGSLPLYGSRLDAGDCRTTALRAVRAQSLLDIGMSFVNAGQERAVRSH